MRMNKFVGVGLLVVVLAMGSVVAGLADSAADDAVSAVATFTIPDYIAISAASATVDLVDSDGNDVTGPNTYSATNALTVLSTKAWSVDHDFVWTTAPSEFVSGNAANLFSVTSDVTSGTWGLNTFDATYSLDLTGDNMQYFPEGSYSITVTHTATTNSGSS